MLRFRGRGYARLLCQWMGMSAMMVGKGEGKGGGMDTGLWSPKMVGGSLFSPKADWDTPPLPPLAPPLPLPPLAPVLLPLMAPMPSGPRPALRPLLLKHRSTTKPERSSCCVCVGNLLRRPML